METSPRVPAPMLSLIFRPKLDAAAAIAASRLGSAPLVKACAIGSPSLDASSTPFNSGIELRSPSRAAFNASPFAMPFLPLRYSLDDYGSACREKTLEGLWGTTYDDLEEQALEGPGGF